MNGVPLPMPAPLSKEELQKAFAALRDEDPRWRAIMITLAQEIAEAVEKSANPKASTNHGTSAHTSGALMGLLDFRDRLVRLRDESLRFEE